MFALRGLSLVVASGGYTSFVAWVSRCSGFSYCGAQALGEQASVAAAHGLSSTGSIVWCTGLVAPQHVESSQTRD